MRERIAAALDGGHLQVFIPVAIALSCLVFTLETMPELGSYQVQFVLADDVFTGIFVIELVVRLSEHKNPRTQCHCALTMANWLMVESAHESLLAHGAVAALINLCCR